MIKNPFTGLHEMQHCYKTFYKASNGVPIYTREEKGIVEFCALGAVNLQRESLNLGIDVIPKFVVYCEKFFNSHIISLHDSDKKSWKWFEQEWDRCFNLDIFGGYV